MRYRVRVERVDAAAEAMWLPSGTGGARGASPLAGAADADPAAGVAGRLRMRGAATIAWD